MGAILTPLVNKLQKSLKSQSHDRPLLPPPRRMFWSEAAAAPGTALISQERAEFCLGFCDQSSSSRQRWVTGLVGAGVGSGTLLPPAPAAWCGQLGTAREFGSARSTGGGDGAEHRPPPGFRKERAALQGITSLSFLQGLVPFYFGGLRVTFSTTCC